MSAKVVAAAVMAGDLIVSLPAPMRHHDIVHKLPPEIRNGAEQGFLLDNGHFIGRAGARQLVRDTKQPLRTGSFSHPTELFSEDLW